MYPIKEDISDVMMAFPAFVSDMMPKYEDIPERYKDHNDPANEFVSNWFFDGLKNPEFVPREGVDPKKAFRHILCIMRSFEPKHEHKIASVAYLLDEWFSSYKG